MQFILPKDSRRPARTMVLVFANPMEQFLSTRVVPPQTRNFIPILTKQMQVSSTGFVLSNPMDIIYLLIFKVKLLLLRVIKILDKFWISIWDGCSLVEMMSIMPICPSTKFLSWEFFDYLIVYFRKGSWPNLTFSLV